MNLRLLYEYFHALYFEVNTLHKPVVGGCKHMELLFPNAFAGGPALDGSYGFVATYKIPSKPFTWLSRCSAFFWPEVVTERLLSRLYIHDF